jgi:hypothetical protein
LTGCFDGLPFNVGGGYLAKCGHVWNSGEWGQFD